MLARVGAARGRGNGLQTVCVKVVVVVGVGMHAGCERTAACLTRLALTRRAKSRRLVLWSVSRKPAAGASASVRSDWECCRVQAKKQASKQANQSAQPAASQQPARRVEASGGRFDGKFGGRFDGVARVDWTGIRARAHSVGPGYD